MLVKVYLQFYIFLFEQNLQENNVNGEKNYKILVFNRFSSSAH